ncbi:aldehyde dehydrogenase (NAD(P)(+)) ald5 [Tulasnella sp. JGI-2019a]|nr:aldehyde dehydrogenase (NAD(P)(+)) ald5 [Tulasnella sp. JGI-2019a]
MPSTFNYDFSGHGWEGKSSFSTGLFIGGKFVDGIEGKMIDVINPSTGQEICKVVLKILTHEAYNESWGLKVPAAQRGKLFSKLSYLIEKHSDELAALESLDNGKAWSVAKAVDVSGAAGVFRYYAGWCDKHGGKIVEVDESKLAYTRHEPIGVVGQVIPWNFPIFLLSWKLGPALATGNTVILKPSEVTPLTAIRVAHLVIEAGFPPGVVNIVTGYGNTAGAAISSHMEIEKVAFTGSTIVGRYIMKAAADSNLKNVTLELGGKSPNIVCNDADIDQAVKWSAFGIFFNHG